LVATSAEQVNPAEEWNHTEIISNNGSVQLVLNAVQLVATTLWNDSWRKLAANGKINILGGAFKQGKSPCRNMEHQL
jgi:hypothetical protein